MNTEVFTNLSFITLLALLFGALLIIAVVDVSLFSRSTKRVDPRTENFKRFASATGLSFKGILFITEFQVQQRRSFRELNKL